MNLNLYIDPNYKGPRVITGYLKKLKCDKAVAKFLKKFNKRFFVLDMINSVFGYKEKESSSQMQIFNLAELIRVDPNPRIIEVCDWKFAFAVHLGKRNWTLYADSVSVHNEWCQALKACVRPVNPPALINSPYTIPAQPTPSTNENFYFPTPNPGFTLQEEKLQPQEVCHKPEFNIPSQPNVQNGSKFVLVKTSQDQNVPKPKPKTQDDEDEVKIISGPKNMKKNEEFDRVIPVIYAKERPLSSRVTAAVPLPEENKQIKTEEKKIFVYGRASSAVKERIEFNPTGIKDMMNELDGLGFDKIEVRTGAEIRQKVSSSRMNKIDKNELKTAESEVNSAGFFKQDLEKNGTAESDGKNAGFFKKDLEKARLGGIALKQVSKVNKPKFVERPEVAPDEGVVKKGSQDRGNERIRSGSNNVRGYVMKEKPVYKEVNTGIRAQGNDCDWDDWDD